MRLARARAAALGLVLAALVWAPGDAAAHLFHKMWEPPDTQLTRDTRVLQLLVDDPAGRFDLARQVYEGQVRVRVRPGGFRRWLVRPTEPGMVFKADYQVHRWSGSLQGEARRIDQTRGTHLAHRLEGALDARDRDSVRAGLREMYAVLVEELLEALWTRLDQPDTTTRIYLLVLGYWSVNLEGYFNIRHPGAGAVARSALDAMSRALGDPETDAPAAPEVFDKHRQRFLRVLREGVPAS